MDTNELLEQRGSEYGETHFLVGVIIRVLGEPFIKFVREYPELIHDWVIMASKLVRIVHSPTKLDNYDDLIGYATLAKGIVERMYKEDVTSPNTLQPPTEQ